MHKKLGFFSEFPVKSYSLIPLPQWYLDSKCETHTDFKENFMSLNIVTVGG